MNVNVAYRSSHLWHIAAEFAQARYREEHGAEISPNPQCFVIARACAGEPDSDLAADGSIVGCAGLTFASTTELYSERYLDRPVEEIVSNLSGQLAGRNHIAEIGSLAASRPRAATSVMHALGLVTRCLGSRFLLCTALRPVFFTLARLKVPIKRICLADPQFISAQERIRWGRYYDGKPQVGLIDLHRVHPTFWSAAEALTLQFQFGQHHAA